MRERGVRREEIGEQKEKSKRAEVANIIYWHGGAGSALLLSCGVANLTEGGGAAGAVATRRSLVASGLRGGTGRRRRLLASGLCRGKSLLRVRAKARGSGTGR